MFWLCALADKISRIILARFCFFRIIFFIVVNEAIMIGIELALVETDLGGRENDVNNMLMFLRGIRKFFVSWMCTHHDNMTTISILIQILTW